MEDVTMCWDVWPRIFLTLSCGLSTIYYRKVGGKCLFFPEIQEVNTPSVGIASLFKLK
jgi:hypothetical protein